MLGVLGSQSNDCLKQGVSQARSRLGIEILLHAKASKAVDATNILHDGFQHFCGVRNAGAALRGGAKECFHRLGFQLSDLGLVLQCPLARPTDKFVVVVSTRNPWEVLWDKWQELLALLALPLLLLFAHGLSSCILLVIGVGPRP